MTNNFLFRYRRYTYTYICLYVFRQIGKFIKRDKITYPLSRRIAHQIKPPATFV